MSGLLALAFAAFGVHTAAMLAITGVMASGACRGFYLITASLKRRTVAGEPRG